MAGDSITEPFPIYKVAESYLLFDPHAIAHARRRHSICGVLLGSLPQVPQQSVFLGLPLQLMPEEARVLAEGGHAFVVDDPAAHRAAFLGEHGGRLDAAQRRAFARVVAAQGRAAAEAVRRQAGERKERALRNVAGPPRRKEQQSSSREAAAPAAASSAALESEDTETDTSLFSGDGAAETSPDHAAAVPRGEQPQPQQQDIVPFAITPTTSVPPLVPSADRFGAPLPPVPSSYPLFAHLHRLGYFMMPGLRFGCQYNVYPGDPLRFHSHFLAVGRAWEEEFRIMEIVGGGRLGTGVKKGFMLGGEVGGHEEGDTQGEVRAFCFEWAGM